VPATYPYPEPSPSSPHNPLPLPEDPSYYYPPINNVEKYCRVGQATHDNIAHAHCMLGT
jgi:hypothetical protein